MKTKKQIGGYMIRSGAWAVFLSVAFIALSSAFNSTNERQTQTRALPRALSFAERVAFQRAIEDVYWRHRIWPRNGGENPDTKPGLDAVMSQAQLENKVAGYLHDSLVLEDYWHSPITAQQLQAEINRMARDTKQPEVLQELFEALGNDPAVIAECLARPILAERLIADLSAQDQTPHVESLHTDTLHAISAATTFGQVLYTLLKIVDAADPPCTDQWGATTTTNAPEARQLHTAVWTGTEMIVWGGGVVPNTGGRYNPATNSWTATSTTNAPTARELHTAVWTGTEMIVWGGYGPNGGENTGGRYNPNTNNWRATSTINAPSRRGYHTAVWTGSDMVVWGGEDNNGPSNSGGRYNPSTDSWTATSRTSAPTARAVHTAVWTGSEMIIWGGAGGDNTGGRYNPSTDNWIPTSTTNAPSGRSSHTAVWAGSEMIVWGGGDNTGGRYNPSTDSRMATSRTKAPTVRVGNTAVWTGSEMIVWGGSPGIDVINTGGRYDPSTDSWVATTRANAPVSRIGHTAVWTGNEMIVWGGYNGHPTQFVNSGGRYCGQYTIPNDDFARAIAISTTNNSLFGTNKGSTREVGEPAGENSVWYKWTAPNNGAVHFRIGMDWLMIDVYTGTAINALTHIVTSSGSPSAVNWTVVAGTTYRIRLTKNTRVSAFTLVWSPPNDDFADAIVISTASSPIFGTNNGSTREVGEPAGENSVWYIWTAPNNGTARFRIGMDWLTIDVYTGTAINALTRIATSSGSPSAVNWTAAAGTTYRIRLTKNTRTSAFHLFWRR